MGKRLMIAALIVLALVAAFIGWLGFSWRSDVSDDQRYAPYINRPIAIKDTATLIWRGDKNQYRFRPYSFNYRENSNYNDADLKSVKHYQQGDTIFFHEARSYRSILGGTGIYFIGRDKLETGEEVEFEYYVSFDHQPLPWETLDEFVRRRGLEKASSSN